MDSVTLVYSTLSAQLIFTAIILTIISLASWLLLEDVRLRKKYQFPPLVPGLPFVGNTFQIPKIDQGPYLQRLGERYGEM